MSDYSQVNDYSVKDGLSTGDPNKLIKGSDIDADLAAIATAIATKYDSSNIASQAEAEAETLNTVLMTPLRVGQWADANGGMVGDIQALADPNADQLLGWDDSAGAVVGFTAGTGMAFNGTTFEISHLGIEDLAAPAGDRILFYDLTGAASAWLTVSTGLTITGTNITTNDGAIVHDSLSGFVADEHVAHSGVTLTAGSGLTGGGTIAASRTFNVGAGTGIAVNADDVALSHLGIESLIDPNADRLMMWDDSAGATAWATLSTGLTVTGTTITTNDAQIVHDSLSGFVADEHVAHSGVTLTAGTGLSGGGTIAASRTFNLDVDSLTNNIGATGAVDLDVDEIAIANSTATEKCFAASLLTPEIGTTVTGTTDTLAETDFGKLTQYSNTGTVTITLPNGLKTGFWAVLQKTGASGTVTLSATTTLNTVGSLTDITDQYGAVTVLHLGSNVWTAWGDLV